MATAEAARQNLAPAQRFLGAGRLLPFGGDSSDDVHF